MVENVVVINDYAYINGGAGKVAIMSAIALADAGLNVILFCGTGPVCEELQKSKVKIVCTDQGEITTGSKVKGMLQGLKNKYAEQKLYELLSSMDNTKSIVHLHAWSKIFSSSIFLATKKAKCPVVITGHDYGTVCPNGCFFNFSSGRICNCKPMSFKCIKTNCDKRMMLYKFFRVFRQYLNRSYINGNNIHMLYISDFSKNQIKPNLHWKTQEHFVVNPIDVELQEISNVNKNDTFIYIGRVSGEKGINAFCDALKKGNKKGIVVGDGPIKDELEKKYPDVEFVGWKESNEIKEYALRAKALVFPSAWYEAAPLTIPEVMGKYGLPCIVSDCCAGQDYIQESKNGYIFKSGNVADLCDKMEKVDAEAGNMQQFILNNFNREQYSQKTHSENLIREYDLILKKLS